MGTNYYWQQAPEKPCHACGHGDTYEPVHIGKSSFGWVFTLRVYPDGIEPGSGTRINDLDDWRHIWRDREGTIVDEYGEELSWQKLEEIITERDRNRAGSSALRRHDLDGDFRFCIAHGPGSWDLCVGEFS